MQVHRKQRCLKHRDVGLCPFTSGHLQKLQFLESSSAETVVQAETLASMTTRALYKASIKLYKCDGEVVSGGCTCVAAKVLCASTAAVSYIVYCTFHSMIWHLCQTLSCAQRRKDSGIISETSGRLGKMLRM